MRSISKTEQKIVELICNEDYIKFNDLIIEYLDKFEVISVSFYESKISPKPNIRIFDKKPKGYENLKWQDKLEKRVTHLQPFKFKYRPIVSFIEYLKNNNYIDVEYPSYEYTGHILKSGNTEFFEIKDNEEQYLSIYLDKKQGYISKFISLCGSTIYPLQSLKDFKASDFKTYEQKQTEKQIRISWIGIYTAIFTGLASIVISIIDPFSPKEFYKTVLQELRINNEYNMQYLEEIKKSSVKLDSLKYLFETKDSLNNK